MARALLGRLYEPLDGDPVGMSRIRQQILVDSRELVTLRQRSVDETTGTQGGIGNPGD